MANPVNGAKDMANQATGIGKKVLGYGMTALKWGGVLSLAFGGVAAIANPEKAMEIAGNLKEKIPDLGKKIREGEVGIFSASWEIAQITVMDILPFSFVDGVPAALKAFANTAVGASNGLSDLVPS